MKKNILSLAIFTTLVAACTSTKTTSSTKATNSENGRSVSSSQFSEEDAHQIAVWDEKTAAGTALGEMPESTSGDELVDIADLGMGALLHKANLQCSVLHITVNENARPQTLSATCDDVAVFGPVLTSTGKGGSTPNGTFTVYNKIFLAHSASYNNAPMARMLVFKECPPKNGRARPNCIGVHATVQKNYSALGTPASHGCVRLTMENAVTLWNFAIASGTVKVTVL